MEENALSRWSAVKELVQAAMELPVSEQEMFVRKQCRDDEVLVKTVLRLLTKMSVTDAGIDLEIPVGQYVPDLVRETFSVSSEVASMVGTLIGPYVLLREIARGGMGVVYLAKRSDGVFTGEVAIKVIKRGMDSDDIVRRFISERQILARLRHPNISSLLDGGTTDDGRPYFVMQYVDGVPITTFCDDRKYSIDNRLRLFGQVCDAVQFAHQNLVVHRDLKPKNILITKDGRVKLLDFGIAKLLSDDESHDTTTNSRFVSKDYAAPEQIVGEKVTTMTDVYALGIVLYELLAGARPEKLATTHSLGRSYDTSKPLAPSRVVRNNERTSEAGSPNKFGSGRIVACRHSSAAQLVRKLSGDLDAIALQALRFQPERRYASVEALRADINRHLASVPVQARKESLRYRSTKFLKRHTLGSAASLLAALTIAVSLWQFNDQRIRSERESQRSSQLLEFVVELLNPTNPTISGNPDLTALELMTAGLESFEIRLTGQPELQIEYLKLMAGMYDGHNNMRAALDMWNKAHEIALTFLGSTHEQTIYSSMRQHAYLEVAGYPVADSVIESDVHMAEKYLDAESPVLHKARSAWATTVSNRGDLKMADSLYFELLQNWPASTIGTNEHLFAKGDYALSKILLGEYEQAEPLMIDVLQEYSQATFPERHIDAAHHISRYAELRMHRDDFAAADSLFRISLASYAKYRPMVDLHILNNYANLKQQAGDYRTADSLLTALRNTSLHSDANAQQWFAPLQLAYATLRYKEGRLEDAELSIQKYEELNGGRTESSQISGAIADAKGDLAEAVNRFRLAAEYLSNSNWSEYRSNNAGGAKTANVWKGNRTDVNLDLADALVRANNEDEAIQVLTNVEAGFSTWNPPPSIVARAQELRGRIRCLESRPEDGASIARDILALEDTQAMRWNRSKAWLLLGWSLVLSGDFEEAQEALISGLRRTSELTEPFVAVHIRSIRDELQKELALTDFVLNEEISFALASY